ncbi:MAG TPA: hypothetical protein PKI44_03175 [Candidatus Omnitrophota bacterium]|nr:hypothetical protein [Candidatus Omnitrophota bacterium]
MLSFIAPTSTDKWVIGTKTGNNIVWSITGVVPLVRIEYSKDNGSTYTYPIASSVAGNSSPYEWDIPVNQDIITDHTVGSEQKARIKVTDTSLGAVYGISQLFMVKGSITVTEPSSTTAALKVVEAHNIAWTTPCTGAANMGNVKIQFRKISTDAWTDVATVAFNSSPYASWAPPIDGITGDAKSAQIRITQLSNTEVYDDSDAFEIEGKIALIQPNIEGIVWAVGEPKDIIWTPQGTFSYVKIDYSTNGFSDETQTIVEAASYPNSAHGVNGVYAWTVPDVIGDNVKVRVTATNDSGVKAISVYPFEIKGALTLTQPNGGETWYVGETTRKIMWSANGSIPTVKLEYSKNSGGAWNEIIASTPAGKGAGEYAWPSVVDAISNLCLVRVSDTRDATVKDESNGVFYIKGKLQITVPTGTTRWTARSSEHDIEWTRTGSVSDVKITYAVDGGQFTNVIATSTSGGNLKYRWDNLPNHVSNTYKIKIEDVLDSDVYSTSPDFKIVGSIVVTKPDSLVKVKVGANYKIEWTMVGDFANVRIEYSPDGGTSYTKQVIESTSASNLFYWWNNIPTDTVSANAKIKVTDANDILTLGESAAFKVQGIFDITSPDLGTEKWIVGSTHDITWTTVGNVPNITLEYSTDGGGTWIADKIAQNISNNDIKSWAIPATLSSQARVKISDANDAEAYDISAANFKIRGDLQITAPTSSTEPLVVGTTYNIAWNVTGPVTKVKLQYSVDGAAYQDIAGATDLDAIPSSFPWTVPDNISSAVKIKIIDNNDPVDTVDESDTFTITGKITLSAPVGGETWYVGGSGYAITWSKTGTIPTVKLEYSVGGAAYQAIQDADNLSGNSFTWVIPADAVLSSQVKVRASNTNAAKPTLAGTSDSFTIKGRLIITNPVAGAVWDVAKSKDITWTREGQVGTVNLSYDYGSGFNAIAGAQGLDSSLLKYSWTIPNNISNSVVIRILPTIAAQLDPTDSAAFKIAADISLTYPAGGEVLVVDNPETIVWTKSGTISQIVLKYDTNAGDDNYPNTIATLPATDLGYTWPVPDAISDTVKIKIEDAAVGSNTEPQESGNFVIRGSILVTSPAGVGVNKKVWICREANNINYTVHGSIPNVQLRLSLNNGSTYPDDKIILNSVAAGPGTHTYSWTVPDDTSTQAMVKISQVGKATIYDESDPFTIRGGFTISEPNSSTRWLSGSIGNTISWTTKGIIPLIYIRYTIDAGANWNFINDGSQINNLETYTATVPSVVSYNQAQIKISDANDPVATDTSAAFTIHGNLTLLSPNGQNKFKAGQNDVDSRITWSMVGPIESVILSLSTNGSSGNYSDINTSAYQASLYAYQWSVPTNVLSNNCFIRIRDSKDSTVKDESNAAFKIMDNFSISSPVGGERWVVGASQNVTWNSLGLAPKVSIKYCKEPTLTDWLVVTPSFIANSTTGSYLWTVPATISTTCRAKVVAVIDEVEDSDSYAVSPADFVIKGIVTVTAPNGSLIAADKEKWGCGTQQWIRWTAPGIEKVDIHYFNGAMYVPIDEAQGLNNLGSYEWTIPSIATDLARIRVRDSNTTLFSDVVDSSDNTFRIIPRVVITRPNGLETWLAGTNEAITWTKYGPLDTVQIDYSIDDPAFSTPAKIFSISTSAQNSGTYDWLNIPSEAVSGKVRVKISKSGDADIQDISNDDFRIRARFTIITPDGGQKWTVGTQQNIVWNQVGRTAGVKFTYYRQTDPATYDTFTLNNTYESGNNTYAWTIPAFIQSDLILKVEDKDDNGAFDISTNTFKIMRGIQVTSPTKDSKWYVGDPATITWTYTGTDTMLGIYYSLAGGAVDTWNVIPGSSVAASAGQWTWASVPNYITAQLKIKVGDANDADAYGIGPAGADMAKIRAKFAISAPAGSEEWIIGSQHNITWSNSGTVETVDLHYSTDNFVSEAREIISNLANGAQEKGATYSWTIPDIFQYHSSDPASAHQVRVRVQSSTDSDASAISNPFRIKGEIWVKAPLLNNSWEIGKSSDIKWGWRGTAAEVKITYFITKYTTGSATVAVGSPIISGTGTAWSTNVASGDSIGIGTTNCKNITKWYTVLSVTNDNQIILSTDYAEGNAENQSYCIGRWAPIAENYGTANDGVVANGAGSGGTASEFLRSWVVPDQANDNVLIKVMDARSTESDTYNISDLFKIIGYLIIKTPALDAKLAVDSQYLVKWEWGGTMPLVGITLSTNGFADEDHNIDLGNVPNGAGQGGTGSEQTYDWKVPNHISPSCKLRIFDPRVPSVQSTSPTFKIQGAITLVTPAVALNESGVYECRWIVGEVREIKWNTFGTIPNVDLVYSKDNFQTEIAMAGGTNLENDGTYNWTIPNERLDVSPYYVNVKMRVYDHNDHEVYVQGPTAAGGVDTLKIDYYKITWDIRDLVTNQAISGLKVNDTSGLSASPYTSPWVAEGLSSPVVHWVRAGSWSATFSHNDYGPISEDYLVGWDPEKHIWRKDRTIFKTMETLVVHIWSVSSEFSYDVNTDTLSMVTWLERDGGLVPGSQVVDVSIYDGNYKIKRKTTLVDEANNKHLYYTDIPATVKLWTGTRLNNNGTPNDSDDDYEEVRTMDNVIADCAAYKTGEAPIASGFAGFFTQTWSPTTYSAGTNYAKLQAGKVYTVSSYAGLATGASFTTPVSFTVTIPEQMAAMKESLDSMSTLVTWALDKPISVMDSNMQKILAGNNADPDAIAAQGGIKGIIEDKLNAQEGIIRGATEDMMEAFSSVLVSFEEKTSAAITLMDSSAKTAETAGQTLKSTAEKYSWSVALSPNPVLSGDDVTITCTGLEGKSPVVSIYSWDNQILFNNEKMKVSAGNSNVYTFTFNADKKFESGRSYTFIMQDAETDGFEVGSGTVESMSLTTIAGLASSAPQAERTAKKALDAIKAVEAVLVSGDNINIALTLKNLKDSVDALPAELAKDGPSSRLNNTVDEISSRLKALGGKEGLDLSALFEKALSTSPTVRDMRTKTDEIGSVIEILKQIFEAKFGGKDAPVVSTTLAPGSVKFRIVAVNPSPTKTQKVQVKYDLPGEVAPKDIADLGGLDLEYDSARSIHYVYKTDVELTPGEVRVFEVDVEDIWLIGQDKIADLKGRVDSILSKLEKTAYYTKAKEISDTIYPKLNDILTSQADDTVSRERHIGIYRQNLEVLAQVKEDIGRMEKILVTAGGPPSPEMLAKTKIKADEPNKTMTWIIIFVIIIFTGLLAGVLFFSWNRQSRMIKDELLGAKNSAFPESGSGPDEEDKP